MKILCALGLILLSSTASTKVFAETDVASAKYIMKGCQILANSDKDTKPIEKRDADTTRQIWMCAGAVAATEQIMLAQHDYCPPNQNVHNLDTLKIVSKYMQDNPDSLNRGLGYVVFIALKNAWACPALPKK